MPATADNTSTAELIAHLHNRHAPCPACEYDLHRVNGAKCPECGAPMPMELLRGTQRSTAWFPASLCVAVALGIDGVIFLLLCLASLVGGGGRGAGITVAEFGMATFACAAVLLNLYSARHWWATQTSPQHWRGMWSILISTIVLHVV